MLLETFIFRGGGVIGRPAGFPRVRFEGRGTWGPAKTIRGPIKIPLND